MSLISRVGMKSPGIRLLIGIMYASLVLGSASMIYPFLLMISSSITSAVDFNEFRLIPRYLYNADAVYRKYIADKYSGNVEVLNNVYESDYFQFNETIPAKVDPKSAGIKNCVTDWYEFINTLPLEYRQVGFFGYGGVVLGKMQYAFQSYLRKKYHNVSAIAKMYEEDLTSFYDIMPPNETIFDPQWEPEKSVKYDDWIEFKRTLSTADFYLTSSEYLYQKFLRRKYKTVEELNRKSTTRYLGFNQIRLTRTGKENALPSDWREFVQKEWPSRFVREINGEKQIISTNLLYRDFLSNKYRKVDLLNQSYNRKGYRSYTEIPVSLDDVRTRTQVEDILQFVTLTKESIDPAYRQYLKKKYHGIKRVNIAYTHSYTDFEDIEMFTEIPREEIVRADGKKFIKKYFNQPEVKEKYLNFVNLKYGDINNYNYILGFVYTNFTDISFPCGEIDWYEFYGQRVKIIIDQATRNYKETILYMAVRGRALWNTIILIFASLAISLTINPLAAYALSRFNLRATYKILLFFLATMAFPGEVGMIPGFLLLKQFGMLNTFWALIIPGMANGFGIFIMKGFFDTLPKEIYEAATIDGANEWRIFWRVTMPLSMPVLAFSALGTFAGAYGSFMWAFIVCQNPEMWTLMVWLYQMQNWAPSYTMMAALLLAGIPTLIVFIITQRIIMRGLVLPLPQ